MSHLYQKWHLAKLAEEAAVAERREIEDQIRASIKLADDADGVTTLEDDAFVVKITSRIDRKVDADKLQELAAEAGLTDHLGNLFRWKPEINARAWQSADDAITRPLAGAITAKPGRPSFKITPKESK